MGVVGRPERVDPNRPEQQLMRLTPDLVVIADPPRRRYRFDAALLPAVGHPTRAAFIAACRQELKREFFKHANELVDIDPTSIAPDGNGWRNLP
jgi:hypothetical protein